MSLYPYSPFDVYIQCFKRSYTGIKGIFSTTLAKNLEQVAAILRAQSPGSTCRRGLNVAVESDDEAQEANGVVEWDDEAQDEADEAVESNLVQS